MRSSHVPPRARPARSESGKLVFVSGSLPFDPDGKIDYSQVEENMVYPGPNGQPVTWDAKNKEWVVVDSEDDEEID